jgi:serine/threonine-protein kinase
MYEAALIASSGAPAAEPLVRPGPHGERPRPRVQPADPVSPSALAANGSNSGAGPATPPREPTAEEPVVNPLAVVHHLEAWMPEAIATVKLRGFIQDAGGSVVESIPGRIRVRLGGKGSVYSAPVRGSLSWLGLGRQSGLIDLELRLQRAETNRDNQLRITVVLSSPGSDLSGDLGWRRLCTQIYCDLRAYLMGQTGVVSDTPV